MIWHRHCYENAILFSILKKSLENMNQSIIQGLAVTVQKHVEFNLFSFPIASSNVEKIGRVLIKKEGQSYKFRNNFFWFLITIKMFNMFELKLDVIKNRGISTNAASVFRDELCDMEKVPTKN